MSTKQAAGAVDTKGRPRYTTPMSVTRLYILRHGQTVRHDEWRLNGKTDVDLTDVGRAQLDAAAEDLAGVEFTAVYSSDLQRSRYGGEALARPRNLELRVDSSFREINFGDWEGMNFTEVEAKYPGAWDERRLNIAHHRPPGAETISELWDRVQDGVSRLLDNHAGETVALVAHSGVNRAILLQALGSTPEHVWTIHQDFGCLNIIEYASDGFATVRLANGPNRISSGPAWLPNYTKK